MKELRTLLERLGGLHDAIVHQLVWTPHAQTLRIEVLDLFSNFEGLPEYPGAMAGAIELLGIERITLDVDSDERQLRIDELRVQDDTEDRYRASVTFWPSGGIVAIYRSAQFPQVSSPRL